MAFWNRKKKKQSNTEPEKLTEEKYLDPSLDLESEFARRKGVKDEEFDRIESLSYVRTQCEQVADSSLYITKIRNEYQMVNAYLTDIQKIDTCEPTKRELIRKLALDVLHLNDKTVKYQKKKTNLSPQRFAIFDRYKEDFPEALTNYQNDEHYLQAVSHDMKILESEKLALKEDIRSNKRRRITVRNMSIVFLFLVMLVFAIFIATSQLATEQGRTLFMVVLSIAVVLVIALVFIMRNAAYRLKISEKKLSRAITLLNKTKIKYVNICNSVDYQKAKFQVKNGYQLSHEYELYLMDVKAMQRYESSSKDLDATLVSLKQVLKGLELYDVSVWESQLEALTNEKEMVEVRHSLNVRRQKLREQADYNMGRIEEAKKGIMAFLKKHPEDAKSIMEIVDSYDMEV